MAIVSATAVAVRLLRGWAVRRSMLDLPNDRSSHRVPVPRLGGAAFIPVVLVALASLHPDCLGSALGWAALGGAAALYVVSLVDDLRPLSTGVRFGVQFAVARAGAGRGARPAPGAVWGPIRRGQAVTC